MKKVLCTTAVFIAGLFAASAHADSITLTGSPITIVEGNTGTEVVTLSNQSGAPITLVSGSLTGSFVSGDPTDQPSDATLIGQTCPAFGNTLANGSSCTYTVLISTPTDTGETDHDAGLTSGTFSIDYTTPGSGTSTVSGSVGITVADSTVPEPSSLLLLGTGLLGLSFLCRRLL